MNQIRIGGVPEHFNFLWHLAIAEGLFQDTGIEIEWNDFPGGTGAMCNALRNDEIDLAVLLTEGIVSDIHNGNPSKILQWYVTTPLVWGIHVSSKSSIADLENMKGKKYAISRLGSGSHLMAFVDAKERGWELTNDQFIKVGNLDGAVEALKNEKADIFLWEKFMTKPLVDDGTFRRIGERPTPWPCFSIAAPDHAIQEKEQLIREVLEVVNKNFSSYKLLENLPRLISEKYGLQIADVKEWLQITSWVNEPFMQAAVLEKVMDDLYSLNIIKHKEKVENFTRNLFA